MYETADILVAHTCSLWFACALTKKKELLFFQPLPTHQIQYCATSFFSQNQAKSGYTCCITSNAPHEILLMVA